MCGRYASTRSATDLAALFGVEDLTDSDLVPSYNIAPTDPAPIVLSGTTQADPGGPEVAGVWVARWGFLPPWSRDASGAARMINARAESVATSRAFGEAFARRRCLVPIDGWYEWRMRRPYFMTRPEPVVLGGIWSVWGQGGHRRLTFSIITVPAVGGLAAIHDRMPLILDEERWGRWLAGSGGTELLTAPSSDYCTGFEIRPVSTAVGDVRKDGPELVERLTTESADLSTVDEQLTLF